MKLFHLTLVTAAIIYSNSLFAQDTFSIVAADSSTGQVGGAGASCVDLFAAGFNDPSFLSELFPGKGAVNTQAAYLPCNQAIARTKMNEGLTPQQIIDYLKANDCTQDATVRQYGIVGFVGGSAVAAAHTGANCMNVKHHRAGSVNGFSYSIQGNILIDKRVIDSMEVRFLREPGELKCKLMAAMQGANISGADSRCSVYGTSSLFAFLHVADPSDAFGSPSYKIGVKYSTSNAKEPIDSLQKIFDKTETCAFTGLGQHPTGVPVFRLSPNPGTTQFNLELSNGMVLAADAMLNLYAVDGKLVRSFVVKDSPSFAIADLESGNYKVELVTSGRYFYQSLVKQ